MNDLKLKVQETVDWVLLMGNTEMHVTRKSDDLSWEGY
jgi:hypothetical protein